MDILSYTLGKKAGGGKYAPRKIIFSTQNNKFYGTELNYEIQNLDTSNIEMFSAMFYDCENLLSLDLSNFDVSKGTNFSMMFYNCKKLTSLDLSNFNIDGDYNLSYMFSGCSSLQHLDVRNIIFSSITTASYYMNLFGTNHPDYQVPSDCEIIVKDATEKAWINTNFSRLTNVKTVAEYEG